jgi:hypothetical protein
MNSLSIARLMVGATLLPAIPATAFAQPAWTPASEIVGQPVQVTTNGVTDTLILSPGGQVTITSPGGRVVNATWSAVNGQLCLVNAPVQECVPYSAPFQAGTPLTLTSSCGASETWLASATNPPPAPPPPGPSARGERGR